LTPTFFGLSPKDKPILHAQLFDLVYHGKGFTWTEIYNMPVWLRKFYYKKTEEAIIAANKPNTTKKINKPRIARPGIGP
jgi:hypothetical protein